MFAALFAALLAVVGAGFITPSRVCPSVLRDDLLTCLAHVDVNEDGTITTTELDTWIAAHTACLPLSFAANYNGASIVAYCDTDASSNLTAFDWASGSGCFALRSRQMLLCEWCVACGLYPPPA